MTQEKKKWLTQTAKVINTIVSENKYSQDFAKVTSGAPFFDDACKFVNLVYQLREFSDTLENMVKFAEMIEEEPAKE